MEVRSTNRPPYELHLDQVKEGDVLFHVRSNKLYRKVIRIAQQVFGRLIGNAGRATHVAIVVDKDLATGIITVAEVGDGKGMKLKSVSLKNVKKNREGLASVRIRDDNLREQVAKIAGDWAGAAKDKGRYNYFHCLTSIPWPRKFGRKDRQRVLDGVTDAVQGTGRIQGYFNGKKKYVDWYCSEFVVEVYQVAKVIAAQTNGANDVPWKELEQDHFFTQCPRSSTPGNLFHAMFQQTQDFTVTTLFQEKR